MWKRLILGLSFCMIFGLSTGANAVNFDLNGGGGGGTVIDVGTFDYKPNSALAVFSASNLPIAAGTTFTLYTHGAVGSLIDTAGNSTPVPTGMEITAVIGFQERVLSVSTVAGVSTAVFDLAPGTPNFFQMFVDSPANADSSLVGDLSAGTGFADGTQILSGRVTYSLGNFSSRLTEIVPLDSYAPINGTAGATGFNPSQTSVRGQGSSDVTISVTPIAINRDYFFDVPANFGFDVAFNTSQVLPFSQVDPSNYFFDGTITRNLNTFGTLGNPNGLNGNLFLFQVDANQSQTVVPEPGTLLLIGTGLIGLAAFGRKRMRKA